MPAPSPAAVGPRRADAARNTERILAAGRAAIREHGPTVPFYEVARAAGVGQATLYRHFPSKQALVRAIVEENTAALARAVADAGGRFDRAVEALAESTAEHPELTVLMAGEVGSDWYERVIDRVVDILEEARLAGDVAAPVRPDVDRRDLRLAVHMIGGAITAETDPERRDQARRAAALLLGGLLA